ncbi:MAG: tRNA glutamyl-Q(34) synthetase GluQRS [Deltaproteobacteria bacterium]|nr:tRNA glutamyl-Q(34) synthetase GluQRS [Deltaproteobacteria bacterium]
MGYRGRFAPSPTGPLHLGNARTALLAWLDARAHGGALVYRVEDLDTPRVVAGSMAQQQQDLRWLGLDWDEGPDVGGPWGPYVQSARLDRYAAALETLRGRGRAFACTCTRKDLQKLASAPHAGEEGPAYPGTCRGRYTDGADARAQAGREPSWRFRVDAGLVEFTDRVLGRCPQDVLRDTGDVVVRRADGLYAYQLAVVVDDLAMGITDVIRAADLVSSTGRQVQLARALGGKPPQYGHVPLLNGPDGARLQKREPRHTLAGLRAAGADPRALVGWLAHSCGVSVRAAPASPADLVEDFELRRVRDAPDWRAFPFRE